MRRFAAPRCLLVSLGLLLGASPSCGLGQQEPGETQPVAGQGGVGRAAAPLTAFEGHRMAEQAAQERITADACAEAYAAEGAQAQDRCAQTWQNLPEQASDEDDDDDAQAAAREVCRTEGVLHARMADCKDAAVNFLLAQKRGFSLGDYVTMNNFALACSPTALCLD